MKDEYKYYWLIIVHPKTGATLFRNTAKDFAIRCHDFPRVGDSININVDPRNKNGRAQSFAFTFKVLKVTRRVLAWGVPERLPARPAMFKEMDSAIVTVAPESNEFSGTIRTMTRFAKDVGNRVSA